MNNFSGIQLPNDVRSSLLSGLEFIAYFGPWVVIILGFIFLPFIHERRGKSFLQSRFISIGTQELAGRSERKYSIMQTVLRPKRGSTTTI
ncbi:hypothetical protein [Paenibacillus sp. DRB1-1]|uniref:hypothetical protein n=1 Tax=Paenibacillus sp. DRB1-1 TaxID=3422309 RepID=UPI003F95527A